MCFVDESGHVFSHAGLTETWLGSVGIAPTDVSVMVNEVNDLHKFKPYKFNFSASDRSGYGDSVTQSCIWVRPNSLYRDGISNIQIVGHTTQKRIEPLKSPRQGFYIIDTLGTSGEYLVIIDGQISIQK